MADLRNTLARISKAKQLPGTIVATSGTRASARLGTLGQTLHNLQIIGGPIEVGDIVTIDYSSGTPKVLALGPEWPDLSNLGSQVRATATEDPGGFEWIILTFQYGALVGMFEPTIDGLTSAVASASGTTVLVPAIDLDDPSGVTVSYGVSLVGISRSKTILRMPIQLSNKSALECLTVRRCLGTTSTSYAVRGPASGEAYISNCSVTINNDSSGTIYAVQAQGGLINVRHSSLVANNGNGDAYGANATLTNMIVHHSSVSGTTDAFLGNNARVYSIDYEGEAIDCQLPINGPAWGYKNDEIMPDITMAWGNTNPGNVFTRTKTGSFWCRFHGNNIFYFTGSAGSYNLVRRNLVTNTTTTSSTTFTEYGFWIVLNDSEIIDLYDPSVNPAYADYIARKYNIDTDTMTQVGTVSNTSSAFIYDVWYQSKIGGKAVWMFIRDHGWPGGWFDCRGYVVSYNGSNLTEVELPRLAGHIYDIRSTNWHRAAWQQCVAPVLYNSTLFIPTDIEWEHNYSPSYIAMWTYDASSNAVGRIDYTPAQLDPYEPVQVLPYFSTGKLYLATWQYWTDNSGYLLEYDMTAHTVNLVSTLNTTSIKDYYYAFRSRTKSFRAPGSGDILPFTITDVSNGTAYSQFPATESGIRLRYFPSIDDNDILWSFNHSTRVLKGWNINTGSTTYTLDLSATIPAIASYQDVEVSLYGTDFYIHHTLGDTYHVR